MSWECVIPEKAIEDVKTDKKSAKRVEKYMISEKALYYAVISFTASPTSHPPDTSSVMTAFLL